MVLKPESIVEGLIVLPVSQVVVMYLPAWLLRVSKETEPLSIGLPRPVHLATVWKYVLPAEAGKRLPPEIQVSPSPVFPTGPPTSGELAPIVQAAQVLTPIRLVLLLPATRAPEHVEPTE